jgi:nitrate/TMAO reductase-like tetraheme cytochrome c subunit
MRIRGVVATLALTWALALGLSARTPGPAPQSSAGQRAAAPAAAPAAPAPTNDDCLACHEDASLTRADGSKIAVDKAAFGASVHGSLSCVDCHQDLATAELPHAEKLAPVDCSTCHGDEVARYRESVHARARAQGNAVAATCVDCHGKHDIRGAKDPQSRTYHLNIAATCGSCHGNESVIQKGHIAAGDVTKAFADSIHGRALSRSGLIVAPTCSDCHAAHDVRRKTDPASRVYPANVPTTCGKCHEGIASQFEGGVHGAVLAKGNNGAPVCQTCHTAHAIGRAEDAEWQLTVVNQCGSCHADKLKTYRDTFHGQVTELGFRAVATCADCHGNHAVLPAGNPKSPINQANLVQTCRKCHAGASANFVKYDPHADKHDRQRNATLYYAAKFMQILLWGVFGFFGLHTLLWAVRTSRPNGNGKGGRHAAAD